MSVEIGADSFLLIATLARAPESVLASAEPTRVKPADRESHELRWVLSLVHEESQRGEIDKAARSPTIIIVPSARAARKIDAALHVRNSQVLNFAVNDFSLELGFGLHDRDHAPVFLGGQEKAIGEFILNWFAVENRRRGLYSRGSSVF